MAHPSTDSGGVSEDEIIVELKRWRDGRRQRTEGQRFSGRGDPMEISSPNSPESVYIAPYEIIWSVPSKL